MCLSHPFVDAVPVGSKTSGPKATVTTRVHSPMTKRSACVSQAILEHNATFPALGRKATQQMYAGATVLSLRLSLREIVDVRPVLQVRAIRVSPPEAVCASEGTVGLTPQVNLSILRTL